VNIDLIEKCILFCWIQGKSCIWNAYFSELSRLSTLVQARNIHSHHICTGKRCLVVFALTLEPNINVLILHWLFILKSGWTLTITVRLPLHFSCCLQAFVPISTKKCQLLCLATSFEDVRNSVMHSGLCMQLLHTSHAHGELVWTKISFSYGCGWVH